MNERKGRTEDRSEEERMRIDGKERMRRGEEGRTEDEKINDRI